MIGARFILAGVIVYAYLRIRKMSNPASGLWKNDALVGVLMLGGGVGNTAFAEQYVSSGIAAIGIATVPLWAAIFSGFFGQSPTRAEWFGIAVGFLGVAILSFDKSLQANPLGAVLLLVAAASWAFGSVLSRRLDLPEGPMGFAIEMLSGGGMLILAGFIRGERISTIPTTQAVLAWL